MRSENNIPGHAVGLGLFAKLVVAATFLLIVAGGNVTSKDAGLAVPDWPLSFQSVNPDGWTSNMDGTRPGVRDEHSHRLIGATVGLLVTALTVWMWRTEPRAWVRRLGYVAWLAVVVQGVMGGLRVTEKSLALAILHGCFAQAFFCLLIAIATVTSRRWVQSGGSGEWDVRAARRWTLALAAAVYSQLVLGAIVRHTQTGTVWHIAGALAVGVCLMQAAHHVFARGELREQVGGSVVAVFLLYGLQLVVGIATYIVTASMDTQSPAGAIQAYLPTVHLAVGALILGVSFQLALWTQRLAGKASFADAPLPMPEVAA